MSQSPGVGLLLLIVLVTQSGCFFFKDDLDKCREERQYQLSEPAPRLEVPADLEQLPAERRLQVPYGETNKTATPKDQPCLIEPPDYFDQEPV